MLDGASGSQPAVPEQLAQHDIAHPESERGQVHPAQRLQQIVVAAAAADGAQRPPGVEQLEHRAGVVRQPAHDAEVEVDELRRSPSRRARRCVRRSGSPFRQRLVEPLPQRAEIATSFCTGEPEQVARPARRDARVRPAAPPSTSRRRPTCRPPGTRPAPAPRPPPAPAAARVSSRRSESRTRTSPGPEPEGAHHVDRQRDDLRVGERARPRRSDRS